MNASVPLPPPPATSTNASFVPSFSFALRRSNKNFPSSGNANPELTRYRCVKPPFLPVSAISSPAASGVLSGALFVINSNAFAGTVTSGNTMSDVSFFSPFCTTLSCQSLSDTAESVTLRSSSQSAASPWPLPNSLKRSGARGTSVGGSSTTGVSTGKKGLISRGCVSCAGVGPAVVSSSPRGRSSCISAMASTGLLSPSVRRVPRGSRTAASQLTSVATSSVRTV